MMHKQDLRLPAGLEPTQISIPSANAVRGARCTGEKEERTELNRSETDEGKEERDRSG